MKSTNTAPYKIAIFGSAVEELDKTMQNAKRLGKKLASYNAIIVNGACGGVPYMVAYEAYKNDSPVWGFSPRRNIQEQKEYFPDDQIKYQKLEFIPRNYEFGDNPAISMKFRNVQTCALCDAGIIIAGRWGTLNEFTNLFDMGKIIGVLKGSGGIADEIERLAKKINKETLAKILYDSSPEDLVEKVMTELKSKFNE